MAKITVLGGTGYAGSNIVQTAAQRGHTVVAYSRSSPKSPVAGVEYRTGDVTDPSVLTAAVEGADVVISALSPRGQLSEPGLLRGICAELADKSAAAGARLGVVGGAGSLLASEGGPRLADTPEFGDDYRPEALEMAGVLDDLRAGQTDVSWFLVSPAGGFGNWAPGEATGKYRVGGDVLLTDEEGNSYISGADFGLAIVEEIEQPRHENARFTVAY